MDTGLGSGVDIGEGTGCGTEAGKGDTCRVAQQKEERQDKMEEGDTGSYKGEQRQELILTGDLEVTDLVLVLEELGVVEAEDVRQQVGPVSVCPPPPPPPPQGVFLVLSSTYSPAV